MEYRLCAVFEKFEDPEISSFWCDGVLVPVPEELYPKKINDTRRLETTAWIGKDGQTKFTMTVRFGKYALRRYAKGTDLTDTLPDENETSWVTLDLDRKTIEVQLL